MNFSMIQSSMNDEERLLVRRADELRQRAASGSAACTGFLSPRESFILSALGFETHKKASELSSEEQFGFFWGGYPEAQRKIFICLPGFYAYSLPDEDAEVDEALLSGLFDELSEHLTSIFIRKSGYVELTHRDYMGAILGLGIDRSHIGDIVMTDDGAAVFAEPRIAEFLKASLSQIGRDHVRVEPLPEGITLKQSFEPMTGTVASARLDSVVSELVSTSRETAKELIRRGLVEHNYFESSSTDQSVTSGDVISIRREGRVKGGKFIIDSADEVTAKGRVRIIARKYL